MISLKLLGNMRGWLVATLAFVTLHSAGYFAGDWVMHGFLLSPARTEPFAGMDKGTVAALAKLGWGLCYGLGFGAGIGWVFHQGAKREVGEVAT